MASKQGQAQGGQPGQSKLPLLPTLWFAGTGLTTMRSRDYGAARPPSPRTQDAARRRTHTSLQLVPVAAYRTIQIQGLPDFYFYWSYGLDDQQAASRSFDVLAIRSRKAHGPRTCAGGCRNGFLRRERHCWGEEFLRAQGQGFG